MLLTQTLSSFCKLPVLPAFCHPKSLSPLTDIKNPRSSAEFLLQSSLNSSEGGKVVNICVLV